MSHGLEPMGWKLYVKPPLTFVPFQDASILGHHGACEVARSRLHFETGPRRVFTSPS